MLSSICAASWALIVGGGHQSSGVVVQQVALLPMLNDTDERWKDLKDKLNETEDAFFQDGFRGRQLSIIPTNDTAKAITAEGFDFKNEDDRIRRNFFSVGERLHADYVIQVVILDSTQLDQKAGLLSGAESTLKVKIWCLDVKTQTPIIRGETFKQLANGGFMSKGSQLKIHAFSSILKTAFADFLKAHPVSRN
jgi:hypothetical protein